MRCSVLQTTLMTPHCVERVFVGCGNDTHAHCNTCRIHSELCSESQVYLWESKREIKSASEREGEREGGQEREREKKRPISLRSLSRAVMLAAEKERK